MFCSNCGSAESGKFCSQCGTKITASPPPVAPDNWVVEINYETLIAHPIVKVRIARQAALAKPGFTGEMVLDAFDKVTHNPVPSKALAGFLQPLYARMGIATGKTQDRVLRHPVGSVIVATLCSMARNGQAVKSVEQHTDGCQITAILPSDVFALEGNLIVSIHRFDVGTHLETATNIPGQWMDWGKSTRRLRRLITEVETELNEGDEPRALSA